MPPKKKKKKSEKKRKKKKKHKKRSGKYSDSSGSDSDTIYPSDLKREEEADGYRYRFTSHHSDLIHSLGLLSLCIDGRCLICTGPRMLHWQVVSPGWMTSSHPQSSYSVWTVKLTQPTGRTSRCTEETWPGNTHTHTHRYTPLISMCVEW